MPPAWKTEGVTRPKPTKHLARQARRDRAGQPASLAPGDYLLRITARDHSGNEAQARRDLPLRLP